MEVSHTRVDKPTPRDASTASITSPSASPPLRPRPRRRPDPPGHRLPGRAVSPPSRRPSACAISCRIVLVTSRDSPCAACHRAISMIFRCTKHAPSLRRAAPKRNVHCSSPCASMSARASWATSPRRSPRPARHFRCVCEHTESVRFVAMAVYWKMHGGIGGRLPVVVHCAASSGLAQIMGGRQRGCGGRRGLRRRRHPVVPVSLLALFTACTPLPLCVRTHGICPIRRNGRVLENARRYRWSVAGGRSLRCLLGARSNHGRATEGLRATPRSPPPKASRRSRFPSRPLHGLHAASAVCANTRNLPVSSQWPCIGKRTDVPRNAVGVAGRIAQCVGARLPNTLRQVDVEKEVADSSP